MKHFSFFFAILLLAMSHPLTAQTGNQQLWTDVADVSWYDDRKTEFNIYTAEQLAGVAKLVNDGTTSFYDCNFYLVNDIHLKGRQWVPIGGIFNNQHTYFAGSLFGQGKTIYGLTIESNSLFGTTALIGLIGNGGGNMTIQDLTLEEVKIAMKGEGSSDYVGALIGRFWGEGLLISSCHTASGSVIGREVSKYSCIGGMLGDIASNVLLNNCSNRLTVSGGKMTGLYGNGTYTGGLIGAFINSSAATIQHCVNHGKVVGADAPQSVSYTGGIAAVLIYSDLIDCYTTGEVTGGRDVALGNYTGGLVGLYRGNSYPGSFIATSYAAGKLTGGKTGNPICTGGLVAKLEEASISNCLAIQSEITGNGNPCRIIAENIDGSLSNNYSNVPGVWDSSEIGADKLNGAEWTGSITDEPVNSWDSKVWDKKNLCLKWESSTSAIDPPASGYHVTPLSGAVRIDAQTASLAVVYRMNGTLEAIRPVVEGTTLIPLPAGIYLIRIEERTWKVLIGE